ncbi:hypothetical protein EDB82DRAFT_473183 [Fusarium venenatum]|uniref:uncharacterized protein n=1 Tax=Fusarium venenatum TaxID=56646 RepID=UPI001D57AF77|nr:hypothetical protein EDB82DRAFT_473183 [Fusarium venenatum]
MLMIFTATHSNILAKCPFANPNNLFQDLAAVRKQDGIEYKEHLKGYLVIRFDDIVDVVNRPDDFSSRPTVPEFPKPVKILFKDKVPEKGTLLVWDNPDHDRLRKSVDSFFVPRRLQRFEPILRTAAHEIIDGFIDKGTIDMKICIRFAPSSTHRTSRTLPYGEVHEGRIIGETYYAWDIPPPGTIRKVENGLSTPNATRQSTVVRNIPMVIRSVDKLAHNVMQISLQPKDTSQQVKWTPGSHIDIKVGTLGYR